MTASVDGLAKWDEAATIRPSFYQSEERGLQTREERDKQIEGSGGGRGNPRRRYTFQDLLWMRLFFYVKEALRNVPKSQRLPAKVLTELQKLGDRPPSAGRLALVGKDVYVLGDQGEAQCLTRLRQLAMRPLLDPATLEAEVRGRLHVLADRSEIRVLADYPQALEGRSLHAQA